MLIKHWLAKLPPEIYDRALLNVIAQSRCLTCEDDLVVFSLEDALLHAFDWERSIEGQEYWIIVFNKHCNKLY
jgi:hypothetical protein